MPATESALIVISAASGAGKSSLARALVENTDRVVLSVSHTTRTIGDNEVDGREYHFVTEQEFRRMIEAGEFLEYAQVYDNYYGTARQTVMRELESGKNVVLEIDWQGARQVEARFANIIKVFVLPPSIEVLRQRLIGRGRDSDNTIERRLTAAMDDMQHCVDYDYLVVNDDFDLALSEIRNVLPGGSGVIRPVPESLKEKFSIPA
ncbi:MAG: guanylate kinase [Acidiferrobacterales bacterium]|nr:guanylate kinase [Acidiferrobacterales bacterium]